MIWAAIFLLGLYWDTFPQAGLRAPIFQIIYEAQSLLTIIKCHATVFAKEGVSSLLTRKPAITFSKYKRAMNETISSCPASAQDRSVFWEQSPLGWLDTHFAGLLCIPAHWGKQSPVLKCKPSLSSLTLLGGQKRQQWLRDADTRSHQWRGIPHLKLCFVLCSAKLLQVNRTFSLNFWKQHKFSTWSQCFSIFNCTLLNKKCFHLQQNKNKVSSYYMLLVSVSSISTLFSPVIFKISG